MVLEFLATNRAGRRPRAQEQEQEERRRNKYEACRLNEERLEVGNDEAEGNGESGCEKGEE